MAPGPDELPGGDRRGSIRAAGRSPVMTGRGGCRSERACGGGSLRSAAPGRLVAELGAASAAELLEAAARRLNRPCTRVERHGRTEREVVAAAEGADLFIVARDGDSVRLGPKSLGPASRFVLDHALCPVRLVWPEGAPRAEAVHAHPQPPPPPGSPGYPQPPGPPRRPGHPRPYVQKRAPEAFAYARADARASHTM